MSALHKLKQKKSFIGSGPGFWLKKIATPSGGHFVLNCVNYLMKHFEGPDVTKAVKILVLTS